MNREALWQSINDAAAKAKETARQVGVTDVENAEALLEAHGERLRFCAQQGSWYHFDGKRWLEDHANVKVEELAKEVLLSHSIELVKRAAETDKKKYLESSTRKLLSAATIQNAVRTARTFEEVQVAPDDFDRDPMLLCVENGTLDLKTMKLRPHDPANLITKCAKYRYEPGADCPTWHKFLGSSLPDAEVADYLQVLFGYCLTGDISEQKLFIFHGDGANGKSIVIRVLRELLGDYAVIAAQELLVKHKFESHPTSLAELKGARLATCNEVEGKAKLSEVLVKKLTGGDTLQARRMRENLWRFEPTHKIILVSNYEPEVADTDEGIWRRLVMIPFDVVIPIERRDAKLFDKLQNEIEGIFAWAVEGCRLWQAHGLVSPLAVDSKTLNYRAANDPLQQFLDECCLKESNVSKADFYSALENFCKESGATCPDHKAVTQGMKKKGFDESRTNSGRFWSGVSVKAAYRSPANADTSAAW